MNTFRRMEQGYAPRGRLEKFVWAHLRPTQLRIRLLLLLLLAGYVFLAASAIRLLLIIWTYPL